MFQQHKNQGIAFSNTGWIPEALAAFTKALGFKPDDAETHHRRAMLLEDKGELDEAIGAYARATLLQPDLASPYADLGAVLQKAGRLDAAVPSLLHAIRIRPERPGPYLELGNALFDLGRAEPALSAFDQAIRLDPNLAEAHCGRGNALKDLGRFDAALSAYDQAAGIGRAGFEAPFANKATLLLELGRRTEAREAAGRAIAVNPGSAKAWYAGSEIGIDAGDIPRMESLRVSLRDPGERVYLGFALGNAYQDAGDADRAFGHFAEANRLKRSALRYDPESVERFMADTASLFSADFLAARRDAGHESARPIFVLGMPRSGTTLTEQILSAHPAVFGAGELGLIEYHARACGFPQGIGGLPADRLAGMGRDYDTRIGALGPHLHVVDKMPLNFLYAGLIHLILPKARIIHIRRDPMDTCLSCYTHNFAKGLQFAFDLVELGRFFRAYEGLMAHWRQVLPSNRFTEIDYEAIVADMEGEARRLIDFCALPWDPACLSFHTSGRHVRTSAGQVSQPIYTRSVGRWRPYAKHLGPLQEALGR